MDIIPGIIWGIVFGIISSQIKGINGILIFTSSGSSITEIIRIITIEGFNGSSKESSWSYLFSKVTMCIGGIILILMGGTQYLKLGIANQILAIGFAVIIWIEIIKKSKNIGGALIAFMCSSVIGIVTLKLPYINGNNNILALCISLYGIGSILESLKKSLDKNNKDTENNEKEFLPEVVEGFSVSGFIAGIISGMFWGLPTNAVVKVIREDKESKKQNILTDGTSDGVSAGLAMLLVLTGNGARTGAASAISNINIDISPILAIALIIFSIGLSLINYYWDKPNWSKHPLFHIVALIVNIGTVIWFMGIFAVPLLMGGLCLKRVIKESGAPEEIALAAISMIPLMNLIS